MELLSFKQRLFSNNLRTETSFNLNRWTVFSLFIGLLLFIPIAIVIGSITSFAANWQHITETVLVTYSFNSIILVLGTVFFACIFGIPSAWMVTAYKFPGDQILKWALVLPLAIPTYIAAYAYFDILDILNPFLIWVRSIFGFEAMQIINNVLVYFFTALILGSVLYPYVYLLTRASFSLQGNLSLIHI